MAEKENSQMDNRVASYPSEIENSEIDSLQEDIGMLIDNINQFITGQPKQETFHTELYEYTNNANTSEKDDGPPEKYTGKELEISSAVETSSSTSESDLESESEAEIDWSVAGPVLQKHISDLERLHSLNVATSSLIGRLKKLTVQKSMQLLSEQEEKVLKDPLPF